MRQLLTAEVDGTPEAIWETLAGELAQRGNHVDILAAEAPRRLVLRVRLGWSERYLLSYQIAVLDPSHCAVEAAIDPRGPRYALKRALTFGAVDRGYLDAVAVGMANLQKHLAPAAQSDMPPA